MSYALKNVLISDEIDQKCINILRENGIEVTKNTKLTKDELIQEIPKFDGLIVRSATKVTPEVINAGRNLKIIGRAGTGVDNIDVNAATKNGVIVMNTPGGNTLSAAEHTCTMLLAMSRNIANGTESLRAGRWDRKKLMGNEVNNKTLAIIGLGRIGKEVATRMQAFGMTTIGYDPITPPEVSAAFDCEWLPLEEVWRRADYITVHTPLIPQTKNLINDQVFEKCKPGIRVINCARGGIIDEDALLRALRSGKCGGAALDVFLDEPEPNKELISHPNVTSTPHLGASTIEAQSRVAEDIAQQFVDMAQGRELVGAINGQALCNALSEATKPWVELGTSLGALAKRLVGAVDKLTTLSVTTYGPMLQNGGSYLSAAALVGLLCNEGQNGLNLISAPAMAKVLGIKVSMNHQDEAKDSHDNMVTLKIESPKCTHTLTGVVNAGQPVLIAIDGAEFLQGVSLSGHLVLYRSKPEAFAPVVGALSSTGVSILSYNASTVMDGESWNVVQVTPAVENGVDMIKKHVTFVGKISLCVYNE